MLKNLFQDRENSGNIIVKAPNKALLESIYQYNDKINSFEKNIKRAALIFVIIMAVIWIGVDIAGMNSNLVLMFGLLTIFGYPLILVFGAIWVSRPSLKRKSEEMAMLAGRDMDVPDDAVEIEMLFPQKVSDDFSQKKNLLFDNSLHLIYADAEAFYFVDVTGTAKTPYSLIEPWVDSENNARIRHWIQNSKPSAYAKEGVKKKGRLISLIPFVGSFIPDHYLIPYKYTVLHTSSDDYLVCIPKYEMEKIQSLSSL